MRKALIPALFLFCGLVATNVWSRVQWPCATSQAKIAGAIINKWLARAADQWVSTNGFDWLVHSGAPSRTSAGHTAISPRLSNSLSFIHR